MRCPWCGSPVMIRGSSWECGWCGDSGSLKRTPLQQPKITLTLSLVYHIDLPETWNDLKKALGQLAPKNTLLSQLLGKVLNMGKQISKYEYQKHGSDGVMK